MKNYSIEFKLDYNLCRRFADITGDHNSQHINLLFGRRSPYRRNIAHGMLPLSFIGFCDIFHSKKRDCFLEEISASFFKPAFFDETLQLKVFKDLTVSVPGRDRYEYTVINFDNFSELTRGYFTVVSTKRPNDKRCINRANMKSWLRNKLTEKTKTFEQVSEGEKAEFNFAIYKEAMRLFYSELQKAIIGKSLKDVKMLKFKNLAELGCVLMFSPFVGMCVPGKLATFTSFRNKFNQPIGLDEDCALNGHVALKSRSTGLLVEKVSIFNKEKNRELFSEGEIKVKVNRPPIEMPSIKEIKRNMADLGIKDKVVLITGASRGIGETSAKLMAVYGAKVVVNYFKGSNDAKRIVKEITEEGGYAMSVQADIADKEQVKSMVAKVCSKFGTINILVNNAVLDAGPVDFLSLSWDDVQSSIDVSVKGSFNCAKEIIPLMLENGFGKIINMSTVSIEAPKPKETKYVISKSGMLGFTRSLAVEYAAKNIYVNMVEPSFVETDLTAYVSGMIAKGIAADTPMGRNASPMDVAKAILYLSSSLSTFTTGQKIMVTGGNLPFL